MRKYQMRPTAKSLRPIVRPLEKVFHQLVIGNVAESEGDV